MLQHHLVEDLTSCHPNEGMTQWLRLLFFVDTFDARLCIPESRRVGFDIVDNLLIDIFA
jgi:hypothetical protein